MKTIIPAGCCAWNLTGKACGAGEPISPESIDRAYPFLLRRTAAHAGSGARTRKQSATPGDGDDSLVGPQLLAPVAQHIAQHADVQAAKLMYPNQHGSIDRLAHESNIVNDLW